MFPLQFFIMGAQIMHHFKFFMATYCHVLSVKADWLRWLDGVFSVNTS